MTESPDQFNELGRKSAHVLHQSLSPREGVGCVLIFAAVVLAQLPAPQRAERAS